MASPRPDINDMLRSQQASRRSQLLQSRIQASLLTIANWKREHEEEMSEFQHDNDNHTGRTSPGTSCGSNDTQSSIVKVVRFDCDGTQRELPIKSALLAQNSEPRMHHHGAQSISTMERIMKKPSGFKSLARDGVFQNKNPSDMALVKSQNVSPPKHKLDLPVVSHAPQFLDSTTRSAKLKSRKSSKTRGDHIRFMKQYDAELLDSMMKKTSNKSTVTKNKRCDVRKQLLFREEAEEQNVGTSTQDEGNVLHDSNSPNIINNEKNGGRQARLLSKASLRPSLERRVSQLMTMADDIQQPDSKTTILFPRAQQRSNSGTREKLLSGTPLRQKMSSRSGDTIAAPWWNPLLKSLGFLRNSSFTAASPPQKKRPRYSSLKFPKKTPPAALKRNKSLSSNLGKKRASWDDVPDVSEFPPSFFGSPVLVKTKSNS